MMKKIYSYLLAVPTVLAMSLAVSCTNPEPIPTPEPEAPVVKTPTISVSENIEAATISSAMIDVAVTNSKMFKYVYYVRDARPADADLKWTEVAVENDGEYEVEIKDLPSSLASRIVYTFEAYAMMDTMVSKYETCSFQTLQAKAVMVGDMRVSAGRISFVADILPEHCEAFFWRVTSNDEEYTTEDFINDCEPSGWGEPNNELAKNDGVYARENVDPEVTYTLRIQPITLNEAGNGYKEMIGEVIEMEVTTLEYKPSQKEVTPVGFEINGAVSALTVSVKATRNADDNIGGCYFGIVEKSKLGTKSVEDYVNESKWFYAVPNGQTMGNNYQMLVLFNDKSEWAEADTEVSQGFAVQGETEYVLFAMPFDKDRFVGKPQSFEVKTPKLSFEDKANATVVINPTRGTAELTAKFFDGCTRLYYVAAPKGTMNDEAAMEKMIENASLTYPNECVEADSDNNGFATIWQLDANKEYDLFLLPLSSNGNFGKMTKENFSTLTDQISVDPSITMSLVSVGAMTKGPWDASWTALCTVSLDACDRYDYGQIAKSTVVYKYGASHVPTGVELASFLYGEYGFQGMGDVSDIEFTAEFTNWNQPDDYAYIVFIPKNKAGELGTPVYELVTVPGNPDAGAATPPRRASR